MDFCFGGKLASLFSHWLLFIILPLLFKVSPEITELCLSTTWWFNDNLRNIFQDATFSWFLCIGSLWLWMETFSWLWSMARYECGTFGVCVDLPAFSAAHLFHDSCVNKRLFLFSLSLNLISYASQLESVEEVSSMETIEWFYMPWAASTLWLPRDPWSPLPTEWITHSVCFATKKEMCSCLLLP